MCFEVNRTKSHRIKYVAVSVRKNEEMTEEQQVANSNHQIVELIVLHRLILKKTQLSITEKSFSYGERY